MVWPSGSWLLSLVCRAYHTIFIEGSGYSPPFFSCSPLCVADEELSIVVSFPFESLVSLTILWVMTALAHRLAYLDAPLSSFSMWFFKSSRASFTGAQLTLIEDRSRGSSRALVFMIASSLYRNSRPLPFLESRDLFDHDRFAFVRTRAIKYCPDFLFPFFIR